jgi:protein-S-isoprenylcysteine O-methyltransferase Ste14
MTPPEGIAPPNIIPWPPIIYGGAAVAALALESLAPLDVAVPLAVRWVGAAIVAAGLGLDASAMLVMRRYRANILPHRSASALVTSWPFSISRNPIYLGNTALMAGVALVFGNPWFLVMAAVAVKAVTVLAIRREESHLAASFGAAWKTYEERVPRWLRLRP